MYYWQLFINQYLSLSVLLLPTSYDDEGVALSPIRGCYGVQRYFARKHMPGTLTAHNETGTSPKSLFEYQIGSTPRNRHGSARPLVAHPRPCSTLSCSPANTIRTHTSRTDTNLALRSRNRHRHNRPRGRHHPRGASLSTYGTKRMSQSRSGKLPAKLV